MARTPITLLFITTFIVATLAALPKLFDMVLVFLLAGQLPLVGIKVAPGFVFTVSVIASLAIIAHLIIRAFDISLPTLSKKQPVHRVALSAGHYHQSHS